MLDAVEQRVEAVGDELAVRRRDPGLRDAHHVLLGVAPVGDQLGDADQREVVVLGEHPQLVAPGHVALFLLRDDLAQRADRGEPGEPGEVDGGLGVPGPPQHAALAGAQRQHVPGPHQVAGDRVAGSASSAMVRARSAAEMPVVIPAFASTVTVKAVRKLSRLVWCIGGRSSRSQSASVSATQM